MWNKFLISVFFLFLSMALDTKTYIVLVQTKQVIYE